MGVTLLSIGGGGASTASATGYFPLTSSNNVLGWFSGDETSRSPKCRAAGTLRNFSDEVETNGRTTTSTLTVRKNGADTSLTLSITAATTGMFEDVSNTVSIAAGDTYSAKLVHGTGTGTLTHRLITCYNDVTSGTGTVIGCGGGTSINVNNSTYYTAPAGYSIDDSTEADVQIGVSSDATISNLQIGVSANTRAETVTFRSRVNGANGNQTLSVTSTATGFFEDTTNSDSLTAADLFCASSTTGGASGTLTLEMCNMLMAISGASPLPGSATYSMTSSTRYSRPWDRFDENTTEANVDVEATLDFTWSLLTVHVTANTATGTSTFKSRVNAADGNQSVSFGTTVTGVARDTSNTDSITDGDQLTLVGAVGGTGTVNARGSMFQFSGASFGGGADDNPTGRLLYGLTASHLLTGKLLS